jgi:muramidase (phage lysozyme)
MIDFNKGLVDRILPKKEFPQNNSSYNANKNIVGASLANIILLFSTFEAGGTTTTDISSVYAQAKSSLRDIIVYFQNIVKSSSSNRSIIPIKFSFEMDGIGGLVIGHLFKVNKDILPNGYFKANLAQTITGISHTVGNSDWTTKIDALNIILDDPSTKPTFSANVNITAIVKDALDALVAGITNNSSGGGFNGGFNGGFGTNPVPTRANALKSFGALSSAIPLGFRPLLDTIAYAEGLAGVGSYNGYDTIVGFQKIPLWSTNTINGHPNIFVYIKSISNSSTAAGRYQFLYSTWLGLNQGSNVAFTPDNQDKAAGKLLTNNGFTLKDGTDVYLVAKQQITNNTIDVNQNPAFLKFLDKAYTIWASLPNSKGQYAYSNQGGTYTAASIYNIYIEAIKKY